MQASQANNARNGEGLQVVASVNLQEAIDALFGNVAKSDERKDPSS